MRYKALGMVGYQTRGDGAGAGCDEELTPAATNMRSVPVTMPLPVRQPTFPVATEESHDETGDDFRDGALRRAERRTTAAVLGLLSTAAIATGFVAGRSVLRDAAETYAHLRDALGK